MLKKEGEFVYLVERLAGETDAWHPHVAHHYDSKMVVCSNIGLSSLKGHKPVCVYKVL